MSTPESNVTPLRTQAPRIAPERPCWAVYDDWMVSESGRQLCPGVYWHSYKRSAEDGEEDDDRQRPILDEWISSPVHVVACTLNSDDDSEGRLLRLMTRHGVREWTLPMEIFGGSGEDARRILFSMGVTIALKKRGKFMEYLLDQQPEQTITTTSRTGWHESGAFVLPGRTLGSDSVKYQGDPGANALFSQRGELAQWQTQVASKCAGNPVLTLAIGCALAGPLLRMVGVLGGGLHLIGDSSKGKSLAQLISASVWGDPEAFKSSWDVTKGGLEIEAAMRSGTVLALDEIKRANPKHVQEMIYALANRMGKATMTRKRLAGLKLTWCLLVLSSGERSLAEHASLSGNHAHAGAELRMVDVNAGTRPHGAFDEVYGMTGAGFHRQLSYEISQHHGHLGPAFVERLLKDNDREGVIEDFSGIRARFRADNAQAGRVAERFAVIAQAGEMAIKYGLLPWASGSALADCLLLYGEWLVKAGSGNAEDRQILASIRDFIDRHGDSRFSDIEGHEDDARVLNRAGYWEKHNGKRLYLFNSPGLREAAAGFGMARIVRALEDANAIAKRDGAKDQKRNTKKCRVPGGAPKNLYVLDPECLGGDED